MSRVIGTVWWPGELLGVALVVLGVVTVFSAELDRRDAVRAFDAIGGEIVNVQSDKDLQGVDGRLVRVHGKLTVDRPAKDRQFGVTVATPFLTRTVEMQQWREITDAQGHLTYVRNWYDHPIDSSQFKQPARHRNPPFPFSGRTFRGGTLSISGLVLGPEIAAQLPGREPVTPDFSTLPSNLTASFRLADGKLWSNVHPGSPRLGDLRLSWSKRPLREVSILARVEHHVLVPAPHLPAPGYVVMVGDMPLHTMMPGLPRMPAATWLWRILALVLAMAGAWLALAGWKRKPPFVPQALASGVLPVALAGAIAWLGTRWLVSGLWLLLAVLAVGVVLWTLRRSASSGVPSTRST